MFVRGVARVLAVVLFVLAPGLVVLPPSVAAEPVVEGVVSFADVPESSLFHKEISWLAAEGISTGWDVGGGVRQYRPLDRIARDAMAAFLYRKAGSPDYTPPASSPFTDVAPGVAFYKEITWLASEGISTGWDVGGGKREYRPLSPIARDAMAAFLFRFARPGEFTAPVQSPFVDVPAGVSYYTEITWLASSGISTGWDVGGGEREYRPLDGIARDAMAAFLYRYAAPKIPVDPLDPAAGTVTVAPDVEILDPVQLETAVLSTGTVTLLSTKAQDIQPNDVLVAGITAGTPEGLLARVVQVSRDPDGNTVVTTKPATLVDAVVSTTGLLEVTGTPAWSEFIPEQDVTVLAGEPAAQPERATAMAQASADVFNKSFSLKKTFAGEFGKPDAPLTGDGSVTAKSTVTAKAKAKMTLEAGFLQLKEASVTVTPSLTAGHSLTSTGSLKGSVTAKLGQLNSGFTFMVGPVPVVVTSQLKLNANFTLDGNADAAFTSSQTVSSDHGFKYRDDTFSLINTKPTTTGIQKDIKASASLTARASLDADATIKLYGAAGITFGTGPYATTTVTVTLTNGNTTWTCPLELGVQARLGVAAGVEVMGFKLREWTRTTTNDWPLFTDNPCQNTPVVAPKPAPAPTPDPAPGPTPLPSPDGVTAVPTEHVRVGQRGSVGFVGDGIDVASIQWLSTPLPNVALSPGEPTTPAELVWSPTTVETLNYSVRVTMNDGSVKDFEGTLQSHAVPPRSTISESNVEVAYVNGQQFGQEFVSKVTFDLSRTTASDTSPLKGFTDREDPASDFYTYVRGDANNNDVLDVGEIWSYESHFGWYDWEPGNVRTRTIQVTANDTTGAGVFIETEFAVTVTR